MNLGRECILFVCDHDTMNVIATAEVPVQQSSLILFTTLHKQILEEKKIYKIIVKKFLYQVQ